MRKNAAPSAARLALGLAAGLCLSGCSMAGLPQFAPMKAGSAKMAALAPDPEPEADMAVAETDTEAEPFIALAFADPAPTRSGGLDGLISKYSGQYDVPESLVRRVIQRESGYNPAARNGPYLGLMQIRHDTARTMGYHGPASGLLDADTNLHYAVKYLAGAYLVAGRNPDQAVRFYSRGYYYDAKRQGLLEEAGFR
ncbi:MAG: lytic transglycosylase domain-containing protein [Hyphomicrobiales bacterium]|nr:MAG: lytic transglycosylase domain-containing protein [Hyphomicrobiales bacterium]